jgi:hypothetical protein
MENNLGIFQQTFFFGKFEIYWKINSDENYLGIFEQHYLGKLYREINSYYKLKIKN